MNYQELCKQVIDLVKSVGTEVQKQRLSQQELTIEDKGLHNFVTHLDKWAEEQLVAGLENLLPEAGFIAEEGTSTKVGETYQWIIDPIDGTTNFIHGIPAYCISIALQENDQLVIGVVYEMSSDEMFSATVDSKAYLNGEEISVTAQNNLDRALIATGFPYTEFEGIDNYMNLLREFMRRSSGLRRLGSAALDLAYVACGRFEGFFEYGLNPWDVAGGMLIVERAGGKVSDWKGGDDCLFGKTILASNGHLQSELLDIVQEHFK